MAFDESLAGRIRDALASCRDIERGAWADANEIIQQEYAIS